MDLDQVTSDEAADLIKKLELRKAEIDTAEHSRDDYYLLLEQSGQSLLVDITIERLQKNLT